MLYNSVGRLIWCERTRVGISAESLCRGICSRTFLHRLESGERRCEKIMSDALLQRVGVSVDKFIYIMNPEEQDWLLLQEKLIQAVDEADSERTSLLLQRYRMLTAKKCKLHQQFSGLCEVVLEWKNGSHTQEMLDKLQQVWQVTMGNIDMKNMAEFPLSLMECIIRMMHCRIQEDMGEWEEAVEGYRQLLDYLEARMDEEDRVKLYSQIAYRLVLYYLKKREWKAAADLAGRAVAVLKVRGRLFYMRKFLEVILLYGDTSEEEDIVYQEICDALKWLYTVYQVDEEEWVWNIHFGVTEMELCGDLVRARRKALGISQEKLSEGICDAVTISRIECGKVSPKVQILHKIMERLGMKEGCYEVINPIEEPEFFELANRISMLLSLSKGKDAEPLIAELERRAKRTNKFVEQYIENIKALALYVQDKITMQEHFDRQNAALHLTVPYSEKRGHGEWRFSRQEMSIVNAMSYSCEENGKMEEVLRLLYEIKKQYENKPFQLIHYMAGYELTIRNIGNLLGNKKEYEQAIAIAGQGISLGLKSGRGLMLTLLLYDCGWDMEQLWDTGKYTSKESLPYIKASAALNLLFYGQEQSEFFIQHLQKLYPNDMHVQ